MCVHVFVCPAGYYTHVSTLADVQENVMEYLHVLSRPMVINHDHDIIWTEAYMDSVVSLLLSLLVCLLGNTHDYLASILSGVPNENVRLIQGASVITCGSNPLFFQRATEINIKLQSVCLSS